MAKIGQNGFTLIEIVLVIAITGAMFVIIFAGQQRVRSQAQFDASVEQVISTLANAHNEATAGVNQTNGGLGTKNCDGTDISASTTRYLFAGTAWTARDAAAGSTFTLDYYATPADKNKLARNGGSACLYDSVTYNIPGKLRVDTPPNGATRRALFVRDDLGGLIYCSMTTPVVNTNPTVLANFSNAGCSGPASATPLTITLKDVDGHSSQIQIEASGLAKRLN